MTSLSRPPLPYPELIIDPLRNLASYADLSEPGTPATRAWDLDYRPERDIGHISVRERGGAVYRCRQSGFYKVNVFQRSSWHAGIYPWNLSLIVCPQDGRYVIRQIDLCQEVRGARGALCRRDYLYWNLCSHLVGRAVDHELLTMNQALRIQCTHLVELVRYGVAALLRVMESGLAGPAPLPGPPLTWSPDGRIYGMDQAEFLYSEGEITEVFRVREGDIFTMLGSQQEYFVEEPPHHGPEGRFNYQLAIADVQLALGKTRSGAVKVRPFSAELQGLVGGRPFGCRADLASLAALDACILETTKLNANRLLSSTLKDVVAYLSLGQLFNYHFTQGDQRELYEETVRRNSFCIGWKPTLVDPEILAALAAGQLLDGMVMVGAGQGSGRSASQAALA